jgi:hypothetical protein
MLTLVMPSLGITWQQQVCSSRWNSKCNRRGKKQQQCLKMDLEMQCGGVPRADAGDAVTRHNLAAAASAAADAAASSKGEVRNSKSAS